MTKQEREAMMARQATAVPALFRKIAQYQREGGFTEAADAHERLANKADQIHARKN